MSDATSKGQRDTTLKRVSSALKSGKPLFVLASGKVTGPVFHSKADNILLQMIAEIGPKLRSEIIEHPYPEGVGQEPPWLEAFQLLREAFFLKKQKEFKSIVGALLKAMRTPDLEFDPQTKALVVEAQKGPVNVRQLAEKLALKKHWRPGRLTIAKYPASLEADLKRIPAIEKKLRRHAEALGIPLAPPGRPKASDK